MPECITEKIKEAETDNEGLTNDVYFSKDGTVIKVYSRFPLTSFYVVAVDVLALKFRYLNKSNRINNEIQVKKEIKAAGLNAPEIIHKYEGALEFERVEGDSGYEYLDSCTPTQAYEFGEKVGAFLPRLHSRDVALKDFRVSNMIINDDITLIDHEYSDLDANKMLKWFDYFTLASSIRQTLRYKEFKEGFAQKTPILRSALYLSILSSLAHSLLLERSFTRFKNINNSIKSDLMVG